MAKTTQYKVYDCEVIYPQLFEHNMDKGDDKSDAGRKVLSTGGQTKLQMIITEEVKDQMIADGIPAKSMGYEMFKQHTDAEGVADGRWLYVAKRPWMSPFKDEETGELKPFGEPNVVDYNATKEAGEQVHWDPQVNIGNQSKGKAKLSIYKNGSKRIIRLESFGVTEHVPYTSPSDGEVRF